MIEELNDHPDKAAAWLREFDRMVEPMYGDGRNGKFSGKRIYVSGPVSSVPHELACRVFTTAASYASSLGAEYVYCATSHIDEDVDHAAAMRECLREMLWPFAGRDAGPAYDVLLLLPDAEMSEGAACEMDVAEEIGMDLDITLWELMI